jgi:hypothetical protein
MGATPAALDQAATDDEPEIARARRRNEARLRRSGERLDNRDGILACLRKVGLERGPQLVGWALGETRRSATPSSQARASWVVLDSSV